MMETVATQNPVVQTRESNGISENTKDFNVTNSLTLSQSSSECPVDQTGKKTLLDKDIDSNQLETGSREEGVKVSHDKTGVSDSTTNFTNDELKSPVPNFRVEGSGAGDSSITVAVATLTSAVPLNSSSIEKNHNDNGPNSGSGPVSMQSSEEMKLSLVSWYSEPDDPSRLVTSMANSCCGEIVQNSRQSVSMTSSLLRKGSQEEKENQTPEPDTTAHNTHDNVAFTKAEKNQEDLELNACHNKRPQKNKMHVQLLDDQPKSSKIPLCSNKYPAGQCDQGSKSGKPECPRCSRRSKSGMATPATNGTHHHHQQSRNRTPANRRVIASSKSSTELKKPIKSILKNDSRGSGGSGSGSDNRSSMDSLGSTDLRFMTTPLRKTGTVLTTRSESSTKAKFNLNHQIFSDTPPNCSSEDRMVSKLRRIEKYATLRFRKNPKVKSVDLSDTEINNSSGGSKAGTPSDIMTKSMSFLEKSTTQENNSLQYGTPSSANSTLKRQGSLRTKKSSPQWEPCTTRTTALRMQKMQEAKAKSGGGVYYAHNSSGSTTHSESRESIPHLSQGSNHHSHSNSAPVSKSHSMGKDQKPTRVFAKLSSAFGQTASSNQKRMKQEKAIQTDLALISSCSSIGGGDSNGASLSPIPTADAATDLAEQIRQLEKLANRYRKTALRFQSEFEKSEKRKLELAKQLQETQTESNEMIEFLQAEKTTLAESLAEIENEATNWRDQIQKVKNESQNRCSSLVRLSEQHKQEALKSQTLLGKLESQSNLMITSFTTQLTDGTNSINLTRQKVISLTESLLNAYDIPQNLLESPPDLNCALGFTGESEMSSSSMLLPLITSLAEAFPSTISKCSKLASEDNQKPPPLIDMTKKLKEEKISQMPQKDVDEKSQPQNDSLQKLSQAIMEREEAENDGIDSINLKMPDYLLQNTDEDYMSLNQEISELNAAICKLLLVVRAIVMHCDRRVSNVASSILQCLHSVEDEKGGNLQENITMQQSMTGCKSDNLPLDKKV